MAKAEQSHNLDSAETLSDEEINQLDPVRLAEVEEERKCCIQQQDKDDQFHLKEESEAKQLLMAGLYGVENRAEQQEATRRLTNEELPPRPADWETAKEVSLELGKILASLSPIGDVLVQVAEATTKEEAFTAWDAAMIALAVLPVPIGIIKQIATKSDKLADLAKGAKEGTEQLAENFKMTDALARRNKLIEMAKERFGSINNPEAQKFLDQANKKFYAGLEKAGVNIKDLKRKEGLFLSLHKTTMVKQIEANLDLSKPQSKKKIMELLGITSEETFKKEVRSMLLDMHPDKFAKYNDEKLTGTANKVSSLLTTILKQLK